MHGRLNRINVAITILPDDQLGLLIAFNFRFVRIYYCSVIYKIIRGFILFTLQSKRSSARDSTKCAARGKLFTVILDTVAVLESVRTLNVTRSVTVTLMEVASWVR